MTSTGAAAAPPPGPCPGPYPRPYLRHNFRKINPNTPMTKQDPRNQTQTPKTVHNPLSPTFVPIAARSSFSHRIESRRRLQGAHVGAVPELGLHVGAQDLEGGGQRQPPLSLRLRRLVLQRGNDHRHVHV